jgi:hypothetical protein
VVEDVLDVRTLKSEIQRHQNRADLARGIKTFEEEVGVWAEDPDAISLANARGEKCVGHLVDPTFEVGVGVADIAIDNCKLACIELRRPAQEIVDE